MNNSRHIKHLYARAGFGARYEDLHDIANWPVKKVVKRLFKESEVFEPLTVANENLNLRLHPKNETPEERNLFLAQVNKQLKDINTAWVKQCGETTAQLREKMTLFWHNHFSCVLQNAFYQQRLNNIERENALGNFKTLLLQASQSVPMMVFLNTVQNRKGHANENFARELMELFTLGRGHYTEQDIKESARAFTGWGYNGQTSDFAFNPNTHDEGIKTFMGKTGNFCGEDIIDIITANKQTAIFICTKLYKYLVNDTPDASHVSQMADVFYNAKYEITPLLEFVFLSDWFYEDKNIGNLVKSPVELIVGLNRQFYITYENPEVQIQFQRTLGQELFKPPNVAGWAGGRNWIDSSSLMYRLRIPSTILNAGVIDFTGKANPEDEAFLAATKKQQLNVIKKVQAQPDWDKFLHDIPAGTSKIEMARFILEPNLNQTTTAEVNAAPDIKSTIIQIVSTPEYQLC